MPYLNRWQIPGSDAQPIYGNTHLPDDPAQATAVLICCHGYKGYKDYGFFPALCEQAAGAGIVAHRFNFANSGMSHEIETFAKPDRFEHDTWNKQVADLYLVLDAIDADQLGGRGLPKIGMGHSRGGLATILAAGREPDRFAAIAPVAAPADANRFDEATAKQLLTDGRMPIESARTGQILHIGAAWLQDILDAPQAHDPCHQIAKFAGPTLIIHGDDDTVIPLEDAQRLTQAAQERQAASVQLIVIPGADHVLNCPNPWPIDQSLHQAGPGYAGVMADAIVNFASNLAVTATGDITSSRGL